MPVAQSLTGLAQGVCAQLPAKRFRAAFPTPCPTSFLVTKILQLKLWLLAC